MQARGNGGSTTPQDHLLMTRALRLAARGTHTTRPNPRVGCVIAKNGEIIGEGWHERAGEAHAEVHALNQAGAGARGATAVVTLEPCSHHGRTPPCADALIEAGVRRVVYGMEDPNPQVAGRGLERLREAGIEVVGPVQEDAARALNPGFIRRMQGGLPWVRLKMAQSLDGRTAMADGSSKWITTPAARRDVQTWRARSCAIISGVGCVVRDDPELTVREADWPAHGGALPHAQPLRVIVDSHGRSSGKARARGEGSLLVTLEGANPQLAGSEHLALPPDREGRINLRALLQSLAARDINEVLVEAGPTLAGAFVSAGLVDELIIYLAAKLMGSSGKPLFELPIASMASSLPLELTDVRAVGEDWRISARLRKDG